MAGLERVAVDDAGVAIWHARTVPELTDAVRWLAGRLSEVEPPAPVEPPDLSGYVPLADFQALEAQVTAQAGQITDLTARVEALEAPPAP